MPRFLQLILIVLSCLSCTKSGKEDPIDQQPKRLVKILSYNIRHGAPANSSVINMDNIASVIKLQDPDLVALQEVDKNTSRFSDDQAKVLAEKLGMQYFFSKSINYSGGEYGVAILSKHPIKKTERILLSNEASGGEQRSLAIATIDVSLLGEIKFASAHLDLVQENRTVQVEQINALSKQYAKPFIVAGDLNMTTDASEFSLLRKEFSVSCSASCPNTFPADKPNKKIDYILLNSAATKKLTVRSYMAIPGRLESDHLPLLGSYSF